MSTTITLSMETLLLGVPSLVAFSGAVTFVALRGYLTDAVEGHRLLAAADERSARWLFLRGYRRTPHAGPDVTPEPEPLAIAATAIDPDDDEVGDEQPGEARWSWLRFVGATLLFPFAWLLFKASPVVEYVADKWNEFQQTRRERDQVGSGDRPTRDEVIVDTIRCLRSSGHSDEDVAAELKDLFGLGAEPWTLYDEDELRADGMGEVEILLLREGIVLVPTEPAAELEAAAEVPTRVADEDRWAEDSAITDGPDTAEAVNREPYRGVGRHWADGTAQHKVIGPGRHEKLINVPAQREAAEA